MKGTIVLFALFTASAIAADFGLSIGSPVAATVPGAATSPSPIKKTDAAFAVRAENCAATSKLHLAGTAEGMVNGTRRSVPVNLFAGSAPGAYVVSRDWPAQGRWVVSISAFCGDLKAGALVPIGPGGYIREAAKLLSRSPKEEEIQKALKELDAGKQ
jgi:hypothetical protein